MKLIKPKFWNKKNNFLSFLLFPISLFLQILILIKKKITFKNIFKIPVICVGNIYLGGTGKTPLSIFIAHELTKHKKHPAIIKKFYKQHLDEHNLIKSDFKNLFLDSKRANAINKAENQGYDVIILDDGFQDFSIKKDLNILCFNSKQMIGNEMTLPSGPLRQPMNVIKQTKIVLINGEKNLLLEKKIIDISKEVKIFYSKYIPTNIKDFKDEKIFAFAGIGNPENFFSTLSAHNVDIGREKSFPDHYNFNKNELLKLIDESFKYNLQLVTTEKDYFRIKDYGFNQIKYLKTQLHIQKKDEFINEILNYI